MLSYYFFFSMTFLGINCKIDVLALRDYSLDICCLLVATVIEYQVKRAYFALNFRCL